MTPEALLRAARQARANLDLDAVEQDQKRRSDPRYVRVFARDGMYGGSWLLPGEDGGLEVYTAMKLLGATHTDGPRFTDTNSRTSTPSPNTPTPSADPTVDT